MFSAWVSETGADTSGDYAITFDCLSGSCLGETVADGLLFGADAETLTWQAVPDLTAVYAVLRGDLIALRAGADFDAGAASCLVSGVVTASAIDAEIPSPGAAFFYVTHAVGSDGHSVGYDGLWGPAQVCGRVSSACDPGTGCSAPISVASLPFIDANNTCGAPAAIGNYNNFDTTGLCNGLFYAGPELVYELELGAGNDVTATLTPEASADLAVFFVSACGDATSCVGFTDNIGPGLVSTLAPGSLAPGNYYVYVDAFYGDGPSSCGAYSLEITGSAGPAPELLSFTLD